jgi:hypothetical protein
MTATHHEYRRYVFTLAYQAHDLAHTVDFPDFPEIITSGATLATATALRTPRRRLAPQPSRPPSLPRS